MDQIKFLQRGSKYFMYHRPRLVWFQELPFGSAAASRNSDRGGRRAETRIAAVGERKPGSRRSASGNPERGGRWRSIAVQISKLCSSHNIPTHLKAGGGLFTPIIAAWNPVAVQ